MKTCSIIFSLIGIIILSSCGESNDSNDPATPVIPQVSGNYECTGGCSGACTFDATLNIVQDEESFIINGLGGEGIAGEIDSNGQFSFQQEASSCTGHFVDNTAIANCVVGNTVCQQVTYQRD